MVVGNLEGYRILQTVPGNRISRGRGREYCSRRGSVKKSIMPQFYLKGFASVLRKLVRLTAKKVVANYVGK